MKENKATETATVETATVEEVPATETATVENITTDIAPAGVSTLSFNFKDERLTKAAIAIKTLQAKDVENRVELAKVLGTVLSTECYKKDGFKSVGDFADEVFGIKSALAYKLAQVGKRFYNSSNPYARKAAQLQSPLNLAELVSLDDKQLKEVVESGDIKGTQSDLRTTAKRYKAPAKPKAAKWVNVKGFGYTPSTGAKTDISEGMYETDVANRFSGMTRVKANVERDGNTLTYNVFVDFDGNVAVTIIEEGKKPVEKKPVDAPKYTVEELEAMLAAARAAND